MIAILATASVSGSAVGGEKSVTVLDTGYQRAVNQNDAKMMRRILADDFVVVEGENAPLKSARY